ncbi:MAG: lysylphosphatidylglycerol synthase domain-containing protein, partial [Bacteroidota bacterium]
MKTPSKITQLSRPVSGRSRLLNGLIKLVVLLMLTYVIYQQIVAREQIEDIWAMFVRQWQQAPTAYLLLTILLIPLNWAFETSKWQALIKNFAPLSFGKAYQAVLSGVTLSIFTPNRIGEYGGRILFLPAEHHWKGVFATLVGSFAQLLVLIGLGIIGLGAFAARYLALEGYLLWGVLFIGICFSGLMLFCFYNISLVIPLAKKLPFANYLRRAVGSVSVLRQYDRPTLSR